MCRRPGRRDHRLWDSVGRPFGRRRSQRSCMWYRWRAEPDLRGLVSNQRVPARLDGAVDPLAALVEPDRVTVVPAANAVQSNADHLFPAETLLVALSPDCQLMQAFAKGGVAEIVPPVSASELAYVGLQSLSATPDGDLVVSGWSPAGGVVGEFLSNGAPDPAFGHDGWVVLRGSGFWLNGLAGHSGQVFVAGDDAAALCCTASFVRELSPSGRLVRSYGKGGRTAPVRGGEEVLPALEPDGRLLAVAAYMQMGCALYWVDEYNRLGPGRGSRGRRAARRDDRVCLQHLAFHSRGSMHGI